MTLNAAVTRKLQEPNPDRCSDTLAAAATNRPPPSHPIRRGCTPAAVFAHPGLLQPTSSWPPHCPQSAPTGDEKLYPSPWGHFMALKSTLLDKWPHDQQVPIFMLKTSTSSPESHTRSGYFWKRRASDSPPAIQIWALAHLPALPPAGGQAVATPRRFGGPPPKPGVVAAAIKQAQSRVG